MAIMSCHFTDHRIYGIDWLRFSKKEKKMEINKTLLCFRALTFWLWFYFFTIWGVILNLPGVSLQLLYKQILFPQKHLTFWHKKLPEFINCHLQEWWRIYQLFQFISYRYIKKSLITYTNTNLWNSYIVKLHRIFYLWLKVKN